MSLSSPLLFFYVYGAHRDLHSFPTRRSSDLAKEPANDGPNVLPVTLGGEKPERAFARVTVHPKNKAAAAVVRLNKDRKSTRLNSSHPSISYAVFCLKKKRKKSFKPSVTTRLH